jgi:clan AA aspartic protease
MIFGFVHNREAIIQIAVTAFFKFVRYSGGAKPRPCTSQTVLHADGICCIGNEQRNIGIRAVVDTGFTGALTLPQAMIDALDLTWYTQQEGILGDGSRCTFDVYSVTVIWDGHLKIVEVNASEAAPLVGMGLLEGYELQVQAIQGGTVRIFPIELS